MTEDQNTLLVQEAYASIQTGNVEAFLNLLTRNIEWQLPEMDNVPFAGSWRGREGVRQFFEKVLELQDIIVFEPQEYIAQGDKVVVLGWFTMRVKATGSKFSSKWAHVWTVKEGKIVHFYEYVDTAAVSRAHTAAQTKIRVQVAPVKTQNQRRFGA